MCGNQRPNLQSNPDMTGERFYYSVFIETINEGSGVKFHVTGDITSGMCSESKPHDSATATPRQRVSILERCGRSQPDTGNL
ncbi:hypothetical protein GGS26DRAFT_548633 [Hypomontagnella submonticulosa]|nr:hypothetical protein GGS26DRAFT_548633 [Hypomontagnella submonticulosa]